MTYQKVLAEHLARRTGVNPRYSLRAFAAALDIEPSKLSEILAGKKGLSFDRAEKIAARLRLNGTERDLFLLSVQAQHSRAKSQRNASLTQLKEILASRNERVRRTAQRNAWYFGAIKAIRDAGFGADRISSLLRITPLQLENAERFLGRIKRLHPDKSILSYEPLSLVKKLNDDFANGGFTALDAEFAFLSKAQAEDILQTLKAKITEFKETNKNESSGNLHMIFLGLSELFPKEEMC